jgi:hypothetical protein
MSAVFCQFCDDLGVGLGPLEVRVRSNYGAIPSNGSALSLSAQDTLTAVWRSNRVLASLVEGSMELDAEDRVR